MTGFRPRWLGMLPAALLAAVLLAGCTAASVEPPVSAEAEAEVRAADDLTAAGVVLAAVLLTTSDITAAVAEGLVTPAEVDAARAAIADGTLDEWRLKAEAEATTG